MMAADDGKRTEVVCVKVTERMALDLLRVATNDDRSLSDFMYRLLRRYLYGTVTQNDPNVLSTRSHKVDHEV